MSSSYFTYILQKNCKDLKIDINLVNSHENYKLMINIMEAKAQKIIQRIHEDVMRNYKKESNYYKSYKKNVTCCFDLSIKYFDVAFKNALNQSRDIFEEKKFVVEKFITKSVEVKLYFINNNKVLYFKICIIFFFTEQ